MLRSMDLSGKAICMILKAKFKSSARYSIRGARLSALHAALPCSCSAFQAPTFYEIRRVVRSINVHG